MNIIDLSMPIYHGMEVYPGDPEVSVEQVHTYQTHGWKLSKITMGTHTGTHADAFAHMDAQGKTLDQIPLNRFFGEAILVSQHQSFPANTGLFFAESVDIDCLDKILQAKPPFVGGMISESLERALLQAEIITYTDLINLEQLPKDRAFMFYGFPLKIKDGDGSPVRAVAIVD